MIMDFVDWCGHVLNTLIAALNDPENAMKSSLDEVRLFHRLFGSDAPFVKNYRRDAMRDAMKELEKEGLVEGDGGHWKVTRVGRDLARDMKPLWAEMCGTQVDEEEAELLRFLNSKGQQTEGGEPYVWLQQTGSDDLIAAFGLEDRRTAYNKFSRVAEGLRDLALVEMKALPGFHLNLKPTYRGITWERKRGMLRKCDVFVSHSTGDRAAAISLQELLWKAFGNDLEVFVSSDYHSIPGGKVWFTELLEALKSAPVTLLLLSQNSIGRRWINFEAGVGIGAGNLVIPLVVSGFSKEDVGHPLSELQARSLADAKDVTGVLIDTSTHIDRSVGEVDVDEFTANSFALGGSKLEAQINHVPEPHSGGYEPHLLIVGLVNNSARTLTDYRVEAEIPRAVLNPSTSFGDIEVESRGTLEHRFFRMEGKHHREQTLRPGDKIKQFFKPTLIITPEVKSSNALDQKITVSVFVGDVMTQKIEKSVREIFEQQPSFG
jgi:hypothetical protein